MVAWGMIKAGDIVTPIQGTLLSGSSDTVFSGLSTDSRNMKEGVLFWALHGEKHDGHAFLKEAVSKGAAGVVVQRGRPREIPSDREVVAIEVSDSLRGLGDLACWWRHQHNVRVIGITGSAGKTTTKEMAASILSLSGATLRNKGNFNNLIGLPLSLFLLSEAHQTAILEMGMNRAGEIARLTEIADPDVGLITNVAKAHIEGLGSLQGVAKAKVELLEKMAKRSQAILNGDDELLMKTAAPLRREMITFGFEPRNDVHPHALQNLGREGFSFEIRYKGDVIPLRVRVPGIQNVYNALAASAIALALKEPPERIVQGLSAFEGIAGRFTISQLPNGCVLVDDTYNANPHSLKAAMGSLKALVPEGGRIIVGLGDMLELGDETVAAHVEAGEWVAEIGASCFVALGTHASLMIEGARSKGTPSAQSAVAKDHQDMAERIMKEWKRGDLVFLKGSRRVGLEKVVDHLKAKASEARKS
jgi:UDP-N-acetylmuramoyl-tripeptide--D-alanyl-D-alanine ligase